MSIMIRTHLAALVAASALSACGGSGGAAIPALTPQGFWNDDSASLLITPNGELYGVDIRTEQPVLYRGTVIEQADGSIATKQPDGSYAYPMPSGERTALEFSATVDPRSSLSGSVMVQGQERTPLNATYSADFDSSPDLASLSGIWLATDGSSIQFDAAGGFAGTSHGGNCDLSGTATPDLSGKNFYRVGVSFTDGRSGACPLPDTGFLGVLVAGTVELVLGINPQGGMQGPGRVFLARRLSLN